MKRVTAHLVVAVSFIVGIPNTGVSHEINPVQTLDAGASVFKLYVWNTERPNVPLEGTAFVIYSSGNSDNPTLYFLTAAHAILGDNADDNTNLDIVDRIEVRYGGGKGDVWEINKKTIRIPQQWESKGKDFAIFKKVGAGRKCAPLPMVQTRPEDKLFKAMGFPQDFATILSVDGKIVAEAGEATIQEWFVVDALVSPGMSGGPVLSAEGVFAIIEGRHQSAIELKLLIPISLADGFIRESIPMPHPYKPQSDSKAELTYWDTIKNSTDPEDYRSYLDKYPKGEFADLARRRFSETAELLIGQANTLYNQVKYAEAVNLYKKAVRLSIAPDTVGWHINFGISLFNLRSWAEAEVEFRRATQLEPDNPLWHYNLGLTQEQQKKWADFEATQRRLTELEPKNAGKYHALSVALYNQGKYAEAEAPIREAIRLDPMNLSYQDWLKKIIAAQKK